MNASSVDFIAYVNTNSIMCNLFIAFIVLVAFFSAWYNNNEINDERKDSIINNK